MQPPCRLLKKSLYGLLQVLCRLLQPLLELLQHLYGLILFCGLLRALCRLLQAPIGVLQLLHGLLYPTRGTRGLMCPLCGLLHPLCRLFNLFVGFCRTCLGYHMRRSGCCIFYVEYFSLFLCCTCDVWNIISSMWAIVWRGISDSAWAFAGAVWAIASYM